LFIAHSLTFEYVNTFLTLLFEPCSFELPNYIVYFLAGVDNYFGYGL